MPLVSISIGGIGWELNRCFHESGDLTTDTQNGSVTLKNVVIKNVDENVLIGSKVNIPYLNQLPLGFNIAYISRFHPDKNPALMIQIMSELVKQIRDIVVLWWEEFRTYLYTST